MFSMRRFTVERIELVHPGLRPGAQLTFAHISDLHLQSWGPQHDRLVEILNGEGLDFAFLTGDFLTPAKRSAECAARLFRGLRCRWGLYAVRGNWEVAYARPLRRLNALMEGWGASLLVNESRLIPTAAGRVRVVGLDDLARGWPDLAGALPPDGPCAEFTVLLCHAPLGASLLPPRSGVDLVLSGHTHGGQIKIPLLWKMALPPCHGGFLNGLYDVNGLRLYVSKGFGGDGIVPLRFNCPAEVALFRVRPPGTDSAGADGPLLTSG